MEIPPEIIEKAAAAHWNIHATIKWDESTMQEKWKEDCRERMKAVLGTLLDAGLLQRPLAKGSQYMAQVNVTNVPEGTMARGYSTPLPDDREVVVVQTLPDRAVQIRFTTMRGRKGVVSTVKLSNEAAEAMFGIMSMLGFKAPDLIATTITIPDIAPAASEDA